MNNPLLKEFSTPFQSLPFLEIKDEHYLPAFEKSMEIARQEIQEICDNTEKPTFKNTVEALEISGERLGIVSSCFFNLLHAETNDKMQEIAQQVSPLLSEFSNDIRLNPVLFERIQKVYDKMDSLELNEEQKRLLDKQYKNFSRNGANLSVEDKEKLREIDKNLSKLELDFGNNVLAETNAFELHITEEDDLKGLPEFAVEQAKNEAKSRNKEGWVFTLDAPSYLPFMTYADNRILRRDMSLAYGKRAFQTNEYNNEEIVKSIVSLRLERANLLGYDTHADFVLEERMANSPKIVKEFLQELLEKSITYGVRDVDSLREFALETDGILELHKWDHAYYAEKLKQKKFNISQEELKPYFQLEKVVNGAFEIAKRLYGLEFLKREDIQKYHQDVQVYEVLDADGNFISLFYADFFPRKGKKAGAWMTSFRGQSHVNGVNKRPHISIVCNFTKPTDKTPSLLTFTEVTTLFHEFGHALHGMLANTMYESLSGTSVYYDFVELPSQFMENFCYEPEALELFAQHYQTSETIPQEMIEKVKASSNFMEGYQTVRQLSFGILDMAWHAENPLEFNSVSDYEQKAFGPTELYPSFPDTNMSVAFSHLFNGGYSSGYYSYKWSEVLDADAFAYFKENGIFNAEIAQKFKHLLESGGSIDPMKLYELFRGQKPSNSALMQRAGFVSKD